jgi:hypothetical protein
MLEHGGITHRGEKEELVQKLFQSQAIVILNLLENPKFI